MTGKEFLTSAVATLVVAAILVNISLRVRKHSQFWTIVATAIAAIALLASIVQIAFAAEPPNPPNLALFASFGLWREKRD